MSMPKTLKNRAKKRKLLNERVRLYILGQIRLRK